MYSSTFKMLASLVKKENPKLKSVLHVLILHMQEGSWRRMPCFRRLSPYQWNDGASLRLLLLLLDQMVDIVCVPNLEYFFLKTSEEPSLSKVQKSSLLLAYEVNAVGPILVIKHMRPFLKIGASLETGKGFSLVANMSARVGSIGDNGLGGWHSYRASKTALNQLTKTASVELGKKDNIACILLHPGTVDTDLSRPFQKNVAKDKLFTREFSVQKLLSIIDNAKKSDNGKFFAWDGQEIPW